MPFCSLKKVIDNATNPPSGIIEASFVDEIERRRFGVNVDGVITYDEFGEPIYLNGQVNYLSLVILCNIDAKTEENDEKSSVGGRGSNKEYIKIEVSMTADIMEGDLIIYPVGSNDAYRVRKDVRTIKNKKRFIFAYGEVRSTK